MSEQENGMCAVSLSNEALVGLKSIAEQLSLSVSKLLEQLGKGHIAVISSNKLVVAQTELTTSNQVWQGKIQTPTIGELMNRLMNPDNGIETIRQAINRDASTFPTNESRQRD